jgi:hypothetical protein
VVHVARYLRHERDCVSLKELSACRSRSASTGSWMGIVYVLSFASRDRTFAGLTSLAGITCEYTSSDIDGREWPARSASSRAGTPD